MSSFVIHGGNRLSGEIVPQGAKNEALQILCAVLLTPEKVTVKNVPDILDVNNLIVLLKEMGVKTEKSCESEYTFQADEVDLEYLRSEAFKTKASRLRGSIMILGPLLSRFKKGYIPQPGGDKIGRRRLDTHFIGLMNLGARFEYDDTEKLYKIEASGLRGTHMLLDEASVTGTANIVMAAAMAKGRTTIFNAACEPYILQLCRMLSRMGARIEGIGSNLLTIEGVEYLLGIATEQGDKDILGPAHESYEVETFMDGSIMTLSDAPWPGFTPDLISIMLVVATQAKGSVLIHQKMFESRLFFVDKLIDMGAQIILCDPHRATVIGLNREHPLKGIRMSSPDIRAGVALLIAALSASGQSIIDNIDQIDRGYQNIDARLRQLGADITRMD